jgi:integrase
MNMKLKRVRKNGKPWPNNIGGWLEKLPADKRAQLFQRAARAQWGPQKQEQKKADDGPWVWPIDLDRYDHSSTLTTVEVDSLTRYAEAYRFYRFGRHMDFGSALDRLVRPLNDALDYIGIRTNYRRYTLLSLLREIAERRRAFWGWTTDEWLETIHRRKLERQHILAIAFLLCGFSDLHRIENDHIIYLCLARKVFGREYVNIIAERVQKVLAEWGYLGGTQRAVLRTVCEALLHIRSPHLDELTIEHLQTVVARHPPRTGSYRKVAFSRVLASIGTVTEALRVGHPVTDRKLAPELILGVPAEWVRLARAWFDRATISKHCKHKNYYFLLNVGRWLSHAHPEVVSPADWSRELAAEAVSVICQWHGGDWCSPAPEHIKSRGEILAPSTRAGRISILRVFFRDLQDWELIPRRFDPDRSLMTPKSLVALIGPNPRAIADDIWAKLVWAGLNLTADDLPRRGPAKRGLTRPHAYPIELCRALALVWLFAGLRKNEILRLRLGCIRWQAHDVTVPETGDTLPASAVCLLDVPVNKTSTSFTKPVDPIVGEAIAAWEKVRPQGVKLPDEKTGEQIDFLFLIRLTPVGPCYLNDTLIPALCKRAGVPTADVRGNITSHRARSTIASQLYNAREPMTLFELQQWLGHSSPHATQHYAKITPLKMAKSYADAGYFARNLRAIEVLVDQDVVRSGRAATEPWKFYDLGHGYCTYEFFEQCQHRMACAKCDFYMPKESTAALLLEGKTHLLRLLQEIPLGDAEQAAVEDGVAACENLLSKLADVATPAGPTPRQLGAGLVQITSVRPALPPSAIADSRSIGVGSVEPDSRARSSQALQPAGRSRRRTQRRS